MAIVRMAVLRKETTLGAGGLLITGTSVLVKYVQFIAYHKSGFA